MTRVGTVGLKCTVSQSGDLCLIGKTKHLRSEDGSTEENLDIDVLTADLVNLVQAVFTDPQAAPSLLVSLSHNGTCVQTFGPECTGSVRDNSAYAYSPFTPRTKRDMAAVHRPELCYIPTTKY